MTVSLCIYFLVMIAVRDSIQRSTPSSSTYRAAVVELSANYYENDSTRTLTENAKKFVRFIERAAAKDADIIVFPELGLPSLTILNKPQVASVSSLIPASADNYAPCTNTSVSVHDSVRMIACAAQRHGIYVVINLFEKEHCSGEDCPTDGIFVYITNVAFDREGKIISRARKFHLIGTFGVITIPKSPDVSPIETDFGVTFGNVVCFDLMFEEPTLTFTRKLNLTDVVLTSGLYTIMPFLSTAQVEAGWAYTEDMNLLASGHNRVNTGHSGSGIYAGREGILTATLPLDSRDELLIADVRKKNRNNATVPAPRESDEHRLIEPDTETTFRDANEFHWIYDQLDKFETELITQDGFVVKKLEHSGLVCNFQVDLANLTSPTTYRLFAYDGTHSIGKNVVVGIRICSIVRCANETIDSCGHVRNSATAFNSIEITATYVDNTRTLMMPNTLATNMLPVRSWKMNEFEWNGRVVATISSTRTIRNLITFGLWGRNFETDRSSIQDFQSLFYGVPRRV